ncbi:MAG: hypothetical protein P8165_15345 [Deltaproteobacteria bacterium]
MMKRIAFMSLFVFTLMIPLSSVYATNGDNIIGVGPIARSMGGVGIASPQDAISAVFANPAAMCFGPYCPSSEFNFAATGFKPDVSAKIKLPGQTIEADSDEKVYPIPAIGISSPLPKRHLFGDSASLPTGYRVSEWITKGLRWINPSSTISVRPDNIRSRPGPIRTCRS